MGRIGSTPAYTFEESETRLAPLKISNITLYNVPPQSLYVDSIDEYATYWNVWKASCLEPETLLALCRLSIFKETILNFSFYALRVYEWKNNFTIPLSGRHIA